MMMASIVLRCGLLLLTLIGGDAKNYILDITVNCGTAKGNNPVVNILTDVAISARARCYGGDKTFTTTDKVHYTLPGTLTSAKKTCRWHKRTGSYTYAVDVLVRYGEVGSLILTKDKIRTVVCTYDQYGKDASPQHNVLPNFIAPRELGTIVGSIVPSNQLKLSIQDVHNKDVKGNMNMDRKYTIYGQYSGPSKGVGLKPVHCDAVSPSGKRYAILRAGCGDGLVFRKSDGFTTTGKTFRSPYFEGYHLDDSKSLSVECNVTLCTNCAGSSCATVCNGPPTYRVTNGKRGSCVGGYNYKSTCTYVCNPGYGKKFAGISTCGPDGLWTVPQITCIAQGCGTPPAITYGSRTFRSTYYPNYATYKCGTGYNLIGSGIVRCLVTGKWAARPFCRAKNCGTPPGISNGARSFRFTTYRNIATYRCNSGYYLVRSARVQCLSNGKWGTRPYCAARNCGRVPTISNGRRSYRSTYYPNYATYTCNSGYNTIGSRIVRCLTTGKWATRPSCRPKNCGTPPGITYGSRSTRSTYYPNAATYSCRSGYDLIGSRTVRCLTTGKWGPRPYCRAKNCKTPPGITYGTRVYKSTSYPNAATYSCRSGYDLIGSRTVRCLTTGKWGRRPYCRAKRCGVPPKISNGARSYSRTYYPYYATYRCNAGYNRVRSSRVYCLTTGKWGTRPYCSPKNCGSLPTIRYGSRSAKSTYYPAVATYRCAKGYKRTGSPTVRCLTNGKWSTRPVCSKCGVPPTMTYGTRKYSRTDPGYYATYKCNSGYNLLRSARVYCLKSGLWASKRPYCSPKNCGFPPSITYGSRYAARTYFPYAATYLCRSGYDLIGSRIVKCLATGKWAKRPYCRAKRCGVPPSISNGARSYSRTYYPYYATYRCNAGYNMVRSSRVYCLTTGKWGTRPSCSPKRCGVPPKISNGARSYSRTYYPNYATYRCNAGYNMVRSSRVYCLSTGKWGTRPYCSPKNCGSLPGIRYGTRSAKSTYYPAVATYRCSKGYKRTGSPTVRCLTNGKWSARPVCSKCGVPPTMRYGTRTYSRADPGYYATYRCNSGYNLIRSARVYCLKSGLWASKRPYCSPKNCKTPPGIAYGSRVYKRTYYPNAATYSCRSGYYMVGSRTVRCLATGKWSKRPYCRAKNCGRVPRIANGAGTTRSTYFPNAATYKCKKGTTMKGSKTVKCMTNGKWATRPKCVVTSCAQLKLCNSAYRDGEYWIHTPKLNRMKVYCYGLKGKRQQEYITLRHNNTASRPTLQYRSSKCNLGSGKVPSSGHTIWYKIALNVLTAQISRYDYRFTKQVSGSRREYGAATGCSYRSNFVKCPTRGHAVVDLRDTGFMLDPKQKWAASYYKPKCNTIRRTSHIFEGKGDGYCGGCYPAKGLTLAADLKTVAKLKATEPVCR